MNFSILLGVLIAWLQSPDGVNMLSAAICVLGIWGLPGRVCLGLALVLHMMQLM